ncbi:PREDICTED: tribbles homolog 2 [Nicrophorus vespilloides]|uniref:Tribbles homolog 2 n=1 Tax=Nicrophorus vespilloides TaxID=110193 RepID=A0ABM1M5Z3_NICVS|nr:PREDICTED: tribbles homolog 2 [Nicrophorus vespilloides]
MQNSIVSVNLNGMEKKVEVASCSDIVKKFRSSISHPRDMECRVPRVPSDNKEQNQFSHNQNDSFQASIVADKYLLLEQVEGSSLFRCIDVNTQEELVCKVVSRDSHSLVTAHYRLDSHPRISSLHEVFICDRHLYLVFPRAHGDLHSYVRSRKRLRESEAKKIFRQIAETVHLCHSSGIVLRDLKLRKFVFADAQRTELKLESLEDAVVLEEPDSDWLHDKRGCPAYVSPEILKAGAHYSGKAADMWSLGVILYTMLVGRYPFNDSEHASLFAKISRGHFVIPDCLSSRAKCLIRSLLRREPSERITSEDIFYHPWLAKEERDYQSRACDQLVPECSFYDDE